MENRQFISHNFAVKFKNFDRKMRNIWYEYCYLNEFISNSLHPSIKKIKITGETGSYIDNKRLGGLKTHFLKTSNAQSHFIDTILLFEQFIYYMSKENFTAFPEKLGREPLSGQKLTQLIYKKNNIEDIISSIIEEKNRKIFYGNPVDIFKKDPCKFEYKDFFINNYSKELGYFSQIIATRNIIIHNNSKIDSKYLKETKNNTLKEKQHIDISSEYLRETILLLIGLVSELTKNYLETNFNNSYHSGLVERRVKNFRKRSSTNYFKCFE